MTSSGNPFSSFIQAQLSAGRGLFGGVDEHGHANMPAAAIRREMHQ